MTGSIGKEYTRFAEKVKSIYSPDFSKSDFSFDKTIVGTTAAVSAALNEMKLKTENLEIDVVITWSHTATNGLLMLEPGSYFPEHVTLLHI